MSPRPEFQPPPSTVAKWLIRLRWMFRAASAIVLIWPSSPSNALTASRDWENGNHWIHTIEGATGVEPLPNGIKAWVWGFSDGALRLCDPQGIISELKNPLPTGGRIVEIYPVHETTTSADQPLRYALTKEDQHWGLRRLGDDGELGEIIKGPLIGKEEELELTLSRLWDGRVIAQFRDGKKTVVDSIILFDPAHPAPPITMVPPFPFSERDPVLLGDGTTILLATYPANDFLERNPESLANDVSNGVWVSDPTGRFRKIAVGTIKTAKRLKPTGLSFFCSGRDKCALLYDLTSPTQVWRLSTDGTPDDQPLISLVSELFPSGDGRHVWIGTENQTNKSLVMTTDFWLLDTTVSGPAALTAVPSDGKLFWRSWVQDMGSARLFAVADSLNGVYRIDASDTGPPRMYLFLESERISKLVAVKGMPTRFAALPDNGGGVFLFDRDGKVIPPKGKSANERFLPGKRVTDLALSASGERLWVLGSDVGDNVHNGIDLHEVDFSGQTVGKWNFTEYPPWNITSDREGEAIWATDGAKIGYFNGTGGVGTLWEPGVKIKRFPSSKPGVAWAKAHFDFVSRPRVWLIRAGPAGQPTVRLRFGTNEALVDQQAGRSGRSITVGSVSHVQLFLEWPDRNKAVALNGKVSLYISDAKGNKIRERDTFSFRRTGGEEEFSLDSLGTQPATGVLTVRLVYEDDSKTHFECTWPGVNFVPAVFQPSILEKFLRDSRGQAILLWVLALMLIVAVQHPRSNPKMRRFGPASVVMLVTIGSRLTPESFKPDPFVAGALIGGTVIFATVFGLFQPQMLRRLSAVFPFDFAVPIGLGWGRLRLRVFAPYLRELLYKLRADRKGAQWERYIDLPVRVRTPLVSAVEPRPTVELLEEPASALAQQLLDRKNGNDVLIVAPGGHGKSALLRRVVQLVQREFHHRGGTTPLPVFCRGGKTVPDALREGLRPDAFPDDLHNAQAEDGFFLVVIDDARDSSLPLEEFRKFAQTARDGGVRFLVSTRPHAGWEAAFRETRRGMEVEPQRLDESNIDAFIFHYARNRGATPLDSTTRDACRDKQDGTYLPVLVRMALLGNKRGARTVGEIYADVADVLLGDETNVRRQAVWELCRVTYWLDGVRAIARNLPQFEEKIRLLCGAGMLVSNAPKEVRFFHDSMQSFLTAEALWKLEPNPLTLLMRAAGNPQFSAASKDGRGSELFRFCIEVFAPRARVITQLATDLGRWAKTYGGDLAENQIIAAVPPTIFGTSPPDLTSERLLQHSVEAAQALPTEEAQLNGLAVLYATLAPLVWHLEQNKMAPSSS